MCMLQVAPLSLLFFCYYDYHFGDALEIADARVGVEEETCGSSLNSTRAYAPSDPSTSV